MFETCRANNLDPIKLRNLGITLFILIAVGLGRGGRIERLDRCTHQPRYMSDHCRGSVRSKMIDIAPKPIFASWLPVEALHFSCNKLKERTP